MKLDDLADAVVALAPRELAVRRQRLRQHPRRAPFAPLRVEVADEARHGRHDVPELELGDPSARPGAATTALATTVRTSGTSPRTALIMKLVEPWQWVIAWIESAPVCSTTVLTASGWSSTAAWSSVHVLFGHVHARAPRLHPDVVAGVDERVDERVRASAGARSRLRTPTPWTSRTGPFVGAFGPRTWREVALDAVGRRRTGRARRCSGRTGRQASSFDRAVGLPQVAGEHPRRSPERVERGARGATRNVVSCTGEVRRAGGAGCPLAMISAGGRRSSSGRDVAGEDVREQRRRVAPDVEARDRPGPP